ncbi:hypothetical protein LZG04_12095 [Saccharothrix sp. S26]|nr:hypothetical protein [Saccharothrix sp. S26]
MSVLLWSDRCAVVVGGEQLGELFDGPVRQGDAGGVGFSLGASPGLFVEDGAGEPAQQIVVENVRTVGGDVGEPVRVAERLRHRRG